MTHQEVIDKIATLLERHHLGDRGSLGQTEYKRDFFRLFAVSYRPANEASRDIQITGDGLRKEIAERWHLDDSPDSQAKRDLLIRLCRMWDEWQFAWDNYGLSKSHSINLDLDPDQEVALSLLHSQINSNDIRNS